MLELTDWFRRTAFPNKPWLVLGKGPTFAQLSDVDRSQYNLLSLNHAVRELQVDVAHIIDIDVVEACTDVLSDHARYVLMPRVPHVHSRVGHARLEEYFTAVPVLSRLAHEERLVWYNAETAGSPIGGSPVIEVKYFSSEAALSILGEMGARVVHSLGVDGGTSYSPTFATSSTTRLANGQPSFDLQFAELERIASRHGIEYRPLVEPLRIFVGASRRDLVALRVLAYSIAQNASVPVRIVPMVDLPVPRAKQKENRPRTSFSFSRFLIPKLAGYRGRAVYFDSDMLVFGDVAELGALEFGPHSVLCTSQAEPPGPWLDNAWFHPGRQYSVMVLDCDRLRWDIDDIVDGLDDGRFTYRDLMFDLCIVPPHEIGDTVPPEWNHLEYHEPGITRLVHFTVVDSQPWRAPGNPLADLWFEHYREAVAAGAVPPDEVRELVYERLVRPELLDALELAPARRRYAASAADVALDAALDRLEQLEGGRVRDRVRDALRPLSPYVRRARALGPDSVVGRMVERTAHIARRVLT